MTLLKSRLAATDSKLKEIKDAKRASDKARRQQYRQTRADQERKVVLVGEAVMPVLIVGNGTNPISGR
jgi:hypothetical protein